MMVSGILSVIGVLAMIPKGLVRGLEELEIGGQAETVQTTALRSARILKRVLGTWGDLLSLRLQSKKWSKVNAEVKNSQRVIYW